MYKRKPGLVAVYFLLLSVVFFGLPCAADQPPYEDHSLMVVGPFSPTELVEFFKQHFDIVEITPEGIIKVVAVPSARDRLIAEYGAKVEIENIEAYNRSRLDPTRDMGGFTTYGEAETEIWLMSFNPLMRVDTIGYSLEGRPILGVKISDNVETDEDETEIYFNSLIHAREPIGLEITLDLMHQLLDNYGIDPDITAFVDETEIWITPIINPDGYVYNETTNPSGGGMWRKNMRDNGDGSYGVDLNRNWGFLWGYDDIGSTPDGYDETYRGTGPFSEPEMQAVHNFINAHDFPVIVNYHSYGNMYIRPWGFNRNIINGDMAKYNPLLDSLFNLNFYNITPGMYPTNGGAYDWQYGEQFEKRKVFAVLPEVGYWFWPDAGDIDWIVDENRAANLFFIREAQRLWKRPTRSLATTFTHLESLVSTCDENFIYVAEFTNIDPFENYSIDVDHRNLMADPDWLTVSPFSTTVPPSGILSVPIVLSPQSRMGHTNGNQAFGRLRLIMTSQDVVPMTDTLEFDIILTISMTDSDNDGYGDECDVCPFDADNDIDSDGLCAGDDNCPSAFNPLQEDFDSDNWGDSCDNCIEVYNPDQLDLNLNFIGDVCDYTCGDANGDEAVNVGDAVFLINYVFKNGNTPDPLEAGMTNGDEAVNVGDAVYLINYIFKEGDPPICPY